MKEDENIEVAVASASLGVELYISGVREFKLPFEKEKKVNDSVNCICVIWLPYEDPLEIFGLQQGIRWDPILGRRCTGVAVARPCTKPGKIDSLECDFTTYIHALNVGNIKYIYDKENRKILSEENNDIDSDGNNCSGPSKENFGFSRFEDALKFNVEFPHKYFNKADYEIENYCLFRPRISDYQQLISVKYGHEEPPPIFVSLGYISESEQESSIFRPATKWRRALNAIGDGSYNLITSPPINWIGTAVLLKKDWIRSSSLGRVFPLKLLPHYKIMTIVSNFRRKMLDSINMNDFEDQISLFYPLIEEIEEKLIKNSEEFKTNIIDSNDIQSDDDFGTIQLQLRTFVSYPLSTEGSLKPLVNVYHRSDLKNYFFLASLCSVDIIFVDDIPCWNDIGVWDFAHSKIHICVLWKHEKKILEKGGSALELFPFRCVEIDGRPLNLPFNDINSIKAKDNKIRCYFSGRVFLTPVPGSEPCLYFYMLMNGKPFSCIKEPISMTKHTECNFGSIYMYKLERIKTFSLDSGENKTNNFAGNLACKISVWPENSKFLNIKEYSYLNLRPQKGIVYNLLHDYQTKMPDHYSAPTLGPYGVWVGYVINESHKTTEEMDSFQHLFGEAIYVMNNKTHDEQIFNSMENLEIKESTMDGDITSELESNFDNKNEDTTLLDQEYISHDLKRYNEDKSSFKPYVPHMSTLLGVGIKPGIAGEWITFTIQSRDEEGNKSLVGGSKIHIRLRSAGFIKYTFTAEPYGLKYEDDKDNKHESLINVDEGEVCQVGVNEIDVPIEWCSVESYYGVYNCRLRCEKSGQYLLRITMDGLPIAGSPYDVVITPSVPEAKASSTIGEGTFVCKACPTIDYMTNIDSIKACKGRVPRYINSFIVILCDEFGNRISTGGHQLKAKCNSALGNIHVIYDNWDGSYIIYYTIHLNRAIQNFDTKTLDRINNLLKNGVNNHDNKRSSHITATTRAIKQALGVNTRVSDSKIDFNSEDIGNLLFNGEVQYMTTSECCNEKILDHEEMMLSNINDFEICVYLNNKPIYGSPFTPKIVNLMEIRDWYKEVDLHSKESTERKFEKLLESDNFEQAINLMKKLEKKYLHDFKAILQELNREPTEHEQLIDEIGKKFSEQDQWTLLQKNKEKLEQIIRDNNDRENLLITFGRYLLRRLENQMIRRQKVDSDMSAYRILKENNLEPLCHSLEVEYNKFQQQRTRELIRLVSLLETNKLNSLEELMELYQLIADELRSLGRGNLANQFDLVNRCLIEEQQLTNIRETLQRKSDILLKMDEMVREREKALDIILKNFNQAIKMEEDHIDNEFDQLRVDVLRKINLKPSTGIQTDDPLSLTDTIVGPLIMDRILGKEDNGDFNVTKNGYIEPMSNQTNLGKKDYASIVIKKYWKPLMEWDLRCFVKILKQCPRISICLRELFCYFANTRWKSNEKQMSIYGDFVNKSETGRYYVNDSGNINNDIETNANNHNLNNSLSTSENISIIKTKNYYREDQKIDNKWSIGSPIVTSDDPRLSSYRKAIGITKNGFKRLLVSLNLSPELLNSEKIIQNLFHKYSIERLTNSINNGNKNVRVITQELWIPLLRELAYINALIRFDILRKFTLGQNALLRLYKNINDSTGKIDYSVWENKNNIENEDSNQDRVDNNNNNHHYYQSNLNSSTHINVLATASNINNSASFNYNNNDMEISNRNYGIMGGVAVTQDNIKDLNRVTAFRHFCELHLIPLYKQVYGDYDFTTMNILPFSKISSITEQEELLRGLEAEHKDDLVSANEEKQVLTNQSTHEKVECKISNCLKIVISQLKMNIASAIFIQLASKSMKSFEFDITRELVEFKKLSNDEDILKNYHVTEFDYVKPLHLFEYLTEVGIIPGHISGNEMYNIVEKVLSSREEYLPNQLPITYRQPKCLSFPGYIETLSMCIAKGIVRKLSGALWSEGEIRTEVIEHLILYNLYDTVKL